MTATFGHTQLFNRYQLDLTLKLETPLRLSSGRASDDTDAPLMRRFDGMPFIPGSSLRGAIRSEIERIISGVGHAICPKIKSCNLFSKEGEHKDCAEKFRVYQKGQEIEGHTLSDREIADYAEQHLCDVCKLFGSSLYASHLVIEDAIPVGNYPCRIRDGVGIDRDTGAARETVKFDYEVMELMREPALFTSTLRIENLTANDKILLKLVLDLLEKEGLYVGGKRAAGLGRIKLSQKTITGFTNPQELWQRLQNGETLCQAMTWDKVQPC